MKVIYTLSCREDNDFTDYIWKLFSTREQADAFVDKWRERNPLGYEPLNDGSRYNRFDLYINEMLVDEETQ